MGLLCLWFGFAMLSFGFFLCGIKERARPDRHHQRESKTSLGLLCCASVLMWEAREEKKKNGFSDGMKRRRGKKRKEPGRVGRKWLHHCV